MVIDPFGVLEREYPGLVSRHPFLKSVGFNPVAALDLDSDDFPDDARGLAEALIRVEDKNQPHWERSAQDLIAGLIMCDRIENGRDSSLVAVRDWVGSEAETLAREIKEHLLPLAGGEYDAIPAKLNRFTKISGENRELFSILSTAQTQTGWLDSLPIQRDLEKGVIDFSQMKDQPMTVYLILPPRYLATHSTWLRLMVTAVLQPLMRSVRPATAPILFMLDEFAQLGHLAVIEDNLAMMREYGVKLWPLFQDFSQAQSIYKNSLGELRRQCGRAANLRTAGHDDAQISLRAFRATALLARNQLPQHLREFRAAIGLDQRLTNGLAKHARAGSLAPGTCGHARWASDPVCAWPGAARLASRSVRNTIHATHSRAGCAGDVRLKHRSPARSGSEQPELLVLGMCRMLRATRHDRQNQLARIVLWADFDVLHRHEMAPIAGFADGNAARRIARTPELEMSHRERAAGIIWCEAHQHLLGFDREAKIQRLCQSAPRGPRRLAAARFGA